MTRFVSRAILTLAMAIGVMTVSTASYTNSAAAAGYEYGDHYYSDYPAWASRAFTPHGRQ